MKWDEYDATIDTAFHQRPVFFTPLMNYVNMPNGADTYYTGNELLQGHTNYNTIGNRARYIDAIECMSPPAVMLGDQNPLWITGKPEMATRGKQARAVQPQRLSERAPYRIMPGAMRQSELQVTMNLQS